MATSSKPTAAEVTQDSAPPICVARKKLRSDWWRGHFEPGATLSARETARQRRFQRSHQNADARAQREQRAFARWAFSHGEDEFLMEPGHA